MSFLDYRQLLSGGVDRLRALLPKEWKVDVIGVPAGAEPDASGV